MQSRLCALFSEFCVILAIVIVSVSAQKRFRINETMQFPELKELKLNIIKETLVCISKANSNGGKFYTEKLISFAKDNLNVNEEIKYSDITKYAKTPKDKELIQCCKKEGHTNAIFPKYKIYDCTREASTFEEFNENPKNHINTKLRASRLKKNLKITQNY